LWDRPCSEASLAEKHVFGCEAGGLGIRDIDIDDASPEIIDATVCQQILLVQRSAIISSATCSYFIHTLSNILHSLDVSLIYHIDPANIQTSECAWLTSGLLVPVEAEDS
jgi:hypothetical protein